MTLLTPLTLEYKTIVGTPSLTNLDSCRGERRAISLNGEKPQKLFETHQSSLIQYIAKHFLQ